MKGISPLIASVLLIAFTLAVAAMVMTWLGGFTATETSSIGTKGEDQAKCAGSVISIEKNDVKVSGTSLNVTVSYDSGSEVLKNFTFILRDSSGAYGSNTQTDVMNPGEVKNFTAMTITGHGGTSWTELRAIALCKSYFAVVTKVTN